MTCACTHFHFLYFGSTDVLLQMKNLAIQTKKPSISTHGALCSIQNLEFQSEYQVFQFDLKS